jgi:hypothetical protein
MAGHQPTSILNSVVRVVLIAVLDCNIDLHNTMQMMFQSDRLSICRVYSNTCKLGSSVRQAFLAGRDFGKVEQCYCNELTALSSNQEFPPNPPNPIVTVLSVVCRGCLDLEA